MIPFTGFMIYSYVFEYNIIFVIFCEQLMTFLQIYDKENVIKSSFGIKKSLYLTHSILDHTIPMFNFRRLKNALFGAITQIFDQLSFSGRNKSK